MKTLKLVLVVAILSLCMAGYAGEKKKNPFHNTVKITLNDAVKSPRLVNAIYDQLELCKLKTVKPGYCCGWVKLGPTTYQVYAPQQAWIRFFREKPARKVREGRSFNSPE